jgi:hypothetical protein
MCWIAVLPRNELVFLKTTKAMPESDTRQNGRVDLRPSDSTGSRAGCSAIVAALAATFDYQR